MTNISVDQKLLGNGYNLRVVRPRAVGYLLLCEGHLSNCETLQMGIALEWLETVVEIFLIENFPCKAFFNEKLDFQLFFSGFHKSLTFYFTAGRILRQITLAI